MFKVNNKNTRMASLMSLWCLPYNFEQILYFSGVSTNDFEQINAG